MRFGMASSRRGPRKTATLAVAVLGLTGLAGLAGCGGDAEHPRTLVVATHDSWAMSKKVLADFKAKTGITVKVQPQGDAGQLTNKLVLTKDSPIADGVYGIDNTFASRATGEQILRPYASSKLPSSAKQYQLPGATRDDLTPVDTSDVCVNVDDTWFARKKLAPPKTLDDLTKPAYRDLFVSPGATTSSPGLAFLVATIAAKGDDWQSYWKRLMANGTKLTSGWTDAYEVDFTAGGGKGTRPIVTSYSSSPPFTIPKGGQKPTTSALLDTCFRQVEYAGVLKGSRNAKGMREFIDFMLGREFQQALPDNMYVYPVDSTVPLPSSWARYAKVAPHPYSVPPEQITDNLGPWLRDWRDVTTR